jgi:hypothetical protein
MTWARNEFDEARLNRLAGDINRGHAAVVRTVCEEASRLGLEFDVEEARRDPFPLMYRVAVANGDEQGAALLLSVLEDDAMEANDDD